MHSQLTLLLVLALFYRIMQFSTMCPTTTDEKKKSDSPAKKPSASPDKDNKKMNTSTKTIEKLKEENSELKNNFDYSLRMNCKY